MNKNLIAIFVDNGLLRKDEAKLALEDPDYFKKLDMFDIELHKLTKFLWQKRIRQ